MKIILLLVFWAIMLVLLYLTRRSRNVVFWPLLALSLLLLFNLIFTGHFYELSITNGHLYGVPIDILNHSSKVAILALGMTLVIATGGVDLSVGAVMAISGAMSAYLSINAGQPAWICIAAALFVSVIAGMWNGLLVAGLGIQPIIATLILMVAGRGIAQLITDGVIIIFYDPVLAFIGNGYLWIPFAFILMLCMLTVTYLFTRKTAVGLLIEAVGDNEMACRRTGINTRLIKFLVYTFSGFCAGVAGQVATSNIRSADANNIGLYLELDAIMAVVIGGTALTGGRFYLLSSVVGAILIQTLTTTMYAKDVPPAIAPVPKAIVILVVCLLQSERVKRFLERKQEVHSL